MALQQPEFGDALLSTPPPPPQGRMVLQPGQLSKPEKVWSSSSTLVIGFYQAAPYTETFKIFYKKVGAVFGTQVMLTPASILGPELAVRQPMLGEAQYFEYEIKKLKPSTQYVVKIKTNDDLYEVRSDKMVTISREEERTRDNDMRNFVGALVKLGDYDGVVVSYALGSGIFGIRILQIDDVTSSLQLARLTSDYTDSGIPVQAYTLSQVRFGRWGGAITGSKVVNEGELKWLVARAVQMGDKSDAAAAFEARQRMLQAQVERVTMSLEVEWSNRFRSLRIRSLTSLALLALVAVAAVAGMTLMLGAAGQRERDLEARLAASGVRQTELEAELQILHLYRVSLELDVERRLALADPGSGGGNGGGPGFKFGTGDRADSNDTYPHGSGAGNNTTSAGGNTTSGSAGGGGGDLLGVYIAATAFHGGILPADGAASDRQASSSTLKPRRKEIKAGKEKADDVRRTASPEGSQDSSGGGSSSGQSRDGKEVRRGSATASSQNGRGDSSSRSSGNLKGSSSSSKRSGPPGDQTRTAANGGGSSRGSRNGKLSRRRRSGSDADGGGGGAPKADMYGRGNAADLWGLPQQALWAALERSRAGRLSLEGAPAATVYGSGGGAAAMADMDDPQPDAWTFIHYVSHVYALHLQEWMKVQLQKTVRRKVNEMLLPEGRTERGYSDGGGGDIGGVAVGGADGVKEHQGGGSGGGGASTRAGDVTGVYDSEYDEDEQELDQYY